MPKSHDAKPRNADRRLKAKLNNIIPALANYRSPRQLARVRSRVNFAVAIEAQRELTTWLKAHALRWRDYERAYDQAQAERKPLAQIMMAMAANNGGLREVPQVAA